MVTKVRLTWGSDRGSNEAVSGSAGTHPEDGLRSRVGATPILWAAWILLLIAGLTAVSVIDVDGDPATINTPPVVLASGVDVAEAQATREEASADDSDTPDRIGGRAHRALQAIVRTLWRPRAHPIRGP